LENTLTASEKDRVRALVDEAGALLRSGRSREASLVFGRVLIHDPSHAEARTGIERSRLAISEEERRNEARYEDARAALARGDRVTARRLIGEVLESGGHHDQAAALLDRLDERPGMLLTPSGASVRVKAAGGPVTEARRTFTRRAFVSAWTLALVLLAGGLAFSWERLVDRLVEPPSPAARGIAPPARRVPVTSADLSLAEARRCLESGDAAAAIKTLDRIAPADAAWPFARQLRAQAEARLAHLRAGIRP
jgi:hypothetical protein